MAKIVFVQDIVYEYFGVMYISSYVKKHGHECDVIIEYAERDWLKSLKASNPDIVAFSVLTGSYKWALERSRMIKKAMDVPIIFGGVHVYLNPASVMQETVIDAICTGEGEEPVKQLLDSFEGKKYSTDINGFWFRQEDGFVKKNPAAPLIDDLNSLPFADRSIYYKYPAIAKRNILPMLGSRGCPYTCSYCVIPAAKKVFEGQGKFIRERSPENILAEIEHCLTLSYEKEFVHFVEDHFGNNRQLALKVLTAVSKMKNGTLGWGGAIRVERFNKEEYVAALSKTNHGLLGIAVECGDEDYRRDVLKRPVTNEQIIEAATLARKYGIQFDTLNMVGLPGETFEQALMTLDLNIKINPVFANCYVYQPYPGTELQQYSVEHKLMDDSLSQNLGLSFYDRYWKTNPEHNRIINLQRIFGLAVKYPFLKGPLVWLARNNWRISVDLLFGFYYTWWLLYFYKLTVPQVLNLIFAWAKSFKNNPSNESIKQGEGQLYPEVNKSYKKLNTNT
jgi:anaerobic magnesium-protoporphyrin IX monomethyl ester cyclase